MKWLALLVVSAIATSLMMLLSAIIAGKHLTTGFDLVVRSPGALFVVTFLGGQWMLVANDLAATWGISKILGRRVKFRDSGITTEAGEPIPLRTRFRIVYPWFIVGLWTVLTLMIARS